MVSNTDPLLASHLTSKRQGFITDDSLCGLGEQINQAIAVTKATVVVPFRGGAS